MGYPTDPNRFPETMELLNQAIESDRGIAITYPTAKKAFGARMRMYTKINDSRRESKRMFDPGHPGWGRTPFDSLELRMEPPYDKNRPDVPTKLLIEKIGQEYYDRHGIKVEEL